jgi:hypothetical protein
MGAPAAGRECLLELELTLARSRSTVELVTLDSFSPDREEQALGNAPSRRAEYGMPAVVDRQLVRDLG